MNVGMNERFTSYWEGKSRHQEKILFCLYLGEGSVRKGLAAGSWRPEVSAKKRGVVAAAVIPLLVRKRHIYLTHWPAILITPAIPIS